MSETSDHSVTYVLAQIKGDAIVPDPVWNDVQYSKPCHDRSTFVRAIRGDLVGNSEVKKGLVTLVPETAIRWSPPDTFWDRVAKLPVVEYLSGSWHVWSRGGLPKLAVSSSPDDVSIFVVPRRQYDKLSEERDRLTDLRQTTFELHPRQAPSSGAASSTFRAVASHPFNFGRPKSASLFPIPISLLQPEFARFQEDVKSISLDPDLSPLGWKFVSELSEMFEKEIHREEKLHKLLSELFGDGVAVVKRSVGAYKTHGAVESPTVPDLPTMPVVVEAKNETTEGTADGVMELTLYYQEGVRLVVTEERYNGQWRRTRLPSILILHNGPNIQVFGAVWLSQGHIEVLSSAIPLYFNDYNKSAMENLLRFLTALRKLYKSICKVYQSPADHAVDKDQVDFPYPLSYPVGIHKQITDGKEVVPFSYVKRVSDIRLVFTARTATGDDIVVKFGSGHYGVDAHQAAAAADLAPRLLSYSVLEGGMWMVVMQPLQEGFSSCDNFDDLPDLCKAAIKKSVGHFHSLGYVHGDIRDTNLFVGQGSCSSSSDEWCCHIIDFDWAGAAGSVKYPLGVFNNSAVWRPRAFLDGEVITSDDDRKTMEEFLGRRTVIRRSW